MNMAVSKQYSAGWKVVMLCMCPGPSESMSLLRASIIVSDTVLTSEGIL